MERKWETIQITQELYNEIEERIIKNARIEKIKKKKEQKKEIPYLQVIYTGKEAKERWERAEKVKFPTWCTYNTPGFTNRRLGQINCYYKDSRYRYVLNDVSNQWLGSNRMCEYDTLGQLMHDWKIKIVKVKTIVNRG